MTTTPEWATIETAPVGFDGERFNRVLFRGFSKSNAFSNSVCVSGWMDSDRRPVHNYHYKLVITHWMPLPPEPPK